MNFIRNLTKMMNRNLLPFIKSFCRQKTKTIQQLIMQTSEKSTREIQIQIITQHSRNVIKRYEKLNENV